MNTYVIALIRTWVPIIIGTILTILASKLNIVIDPSSQVALVALTVGTLSGAYYGLVRLVEKKFPWVGVLLGVPAQPTQYKTAAAVTTPANASDDLVSDEEDMGSGVLDPEASYPNDGAPQKTVEEAPAAPAPTA